MIILFVGTQYIRYAQVRYLTFINLTCNSNIFFIHQGNILSMRFIAPIALLAIPSLALPAEPQEDSVAADGQYPSF